MFWISDWSASVAIKQSRTADEVQTEPGLAKIPEASILVLIVLGIFQVS